MCLSQRLFSVEWEQLKAYINGKGIGVIGDMPMYVSMDSCDVWSHRERFDLDPRTGRPCRVAGVPPDYFSADGQLWGNPLYNWPAMERDGFAWWCARIGAALSRFDVVRIDHFRAFCLVLGGAGRTPKPRKPGSVAAGTRTGAV